MELYLIQAWRVYLVIVNKKEILVSRGVNGRIGILIENIKKYQIIARVKKTREYKSV